MFQGVAFSEFPRCAEYPGAVPYGSATARRQGIQACPQSAKRVPGPFGSVMPLERLPIIPGCRLERHSTSFHDFFDPDTVVANEKTPSSPLGAYARIFPSVFYTSVRLFSLPSWRTCSTNEAKCPGFTFPFNGVSGCRFKPYGICRAFQEWENQSGSNTTYRVHRPILHIDFVSSCV